MNLITRKEAKAQGAKRYFTGLLCKHGHISARYVSTHQCCSCVTASRPEYIPVVSSVHPRTTAKLENKVTYNTGIPCSREHMVDRYTSSGWCLMCFKNYYATEEQQLKKHQYRNNNTDKKAAYDKEFDKSHKAYRSALKSSNRAKRIQRLVSWDNELTTFVFEEAVRLCDLRKKATGYSWHVDHVVPLNGRRVSGLHVWNNFAVIPAAQNMSKGNRYVME
jgi:hypothetical protein